MRNSTEIPDGYKDSPLGIIPEDWEVRRLGECFDISAGRDLEKPFFSEIRTELFVYPVYSNSLDNKGLYGFTSKPRCKANSITITGRGYLGHAEYRFSDFDAIVRLLVLHPKIEIVCGLIADYINFKKPFVYESTGVPQLTVPQVKRSCLLIPPYEEQIRLYQVLKLWDAAIEKQEELIDKLTLRKRGLMQQLLTGKKRLPGFSGKWEQVRLGAVCTFFRNVTLSRDQLNDTDGQIQNVHYGDVLIKYPSILDCSGVSLPYINKDVVINSNADLVQNGDIIMSDTAEDETAGKACEVINVGDRKILAGLHTMLIRPNSGVFAPCFLGYYINSECYHKQLMPLIQGIKVCSLGKQAVQNTILSVPSRKEQEKIVEILTLCESEIRSAVKKKAEMQSQKRGLMQQLLTGKKRINFE